MRTLNSSPPDSDAGSQAPDGDGWVHEIKHDGYRTELIVEGGKARAFTRNGHDWSEQYRAHRPDGEGLQRWVGGQRAVEESTLHLALL